MTVCLFVWKFVNNVDDKFVNFGYFPDIDDIEESLEHAQIERSVICKMVMEVGEKFHLSELVSNMKW